MQIKRDARIGLVLRGGPVNGPFSAAAARTIKSTLAGAGLKVSAIYANSASVPAGVMSAIDQDERCCAIWARLRPYDIVGTTKGWWDKAVTMWHVLTNQSIFPGQPLWQIIDRSVPVDEVFGESAIMTKFMTVDYWTGRHVIFSNRVPGHRRSWKRGMLGSMALVPFLPPVLVDDAVHDGLIDAVYDNKIIRRNQALLLLDGGYFDNLLLDEACRDGMDTIFVVDINELKLGPLDTELWNHWAFPLQRAFSVLITTNDQRRLHGVNRTNEILAIRKELMELRARADVGGAVETAIDTVITRMDKGLLALADKHPVEIVTIGDLPHSIPFDFANFQPWEVEHLLQCGHDAAKRALADLEVIE